MLVPMLMCMEFLQVTYLNSVVMPDEEGSSSDDEDNSNDNEEDSEEDVGDNEE